MEKQIIALGYRTANEQLKNETRTWTEKNSNRTERVGLKNEDREPGEREEEEDNF